MLRLQNMKIAYKILLAISILVALVGGGIYYAAGKMKETDARYSDFLDNDAQSAILAARLQRVAYQLNFLLYKIVAITDDAGMQEAAKAIDALDEDIGNSFDSIIKFTPEHTKDIEELRSTFTQAFAVAHEAMALALKNSNEEAAAIIRGRIDPMLAAFVKQSGAMRTKITDNLGKQGDELSLDVQAGIWMTLTIVAGGLLVGAVLAFLIAQFGIARPINALAKLMERVAAGEYGVNVPGQARRDEVGAMSRSVEVFRQNGIETERLKAEQEAIEARATAEKHEMMERLAEGFETSVGGVVRSVSAASQQISAGAAMLANAAEEASRQAQNVAAASVETSSNVQTVSSATEEMSASIAEIGKQVTGAQTIAISAVDQASKTAAIVGRLADTAQRIGQVVELINSIAEQTNLLALNATIEAARAGEAGRGFAVVANEVKALAGQTAKATQEISGQISGVQGATGEAVGAIDAISTTIEQIKQITVSIASAVEQQTAATREIARNVEQAASGTEDVTRNIGSVSDAAASTGSAAEQMRTSSTTLAQDAETLRREVDAFITRVRAA